MVDAYEYYLKGSEEYDKEHYAEAISCFERSNEIEEHFKSYERLYSCLMHLGDTQKAFACIERAYQLNPRNDKTAFEYARMLAGSGDSISAQEVLAGIIQRDPSYKKAAALADSLRQKADNELLDK